jgi:hypothetical protein
MVSSKDCGSGTTRKSAPQHSDEKHQRPKPVLELCCQGTGLVNLQGRSVEGGVGFPQDLRSNVIREAYPEEPSLFCSGLAHSHQNHISRSLCHTNHPQQ